MRVALTTLCPGGASVDRLTVVVWVEGMSAAHSYMCWRRTESKTELFWVEKENVAKSFTLTLNTFSNLKVADEVLYACVGVC